MNIYEKAEVKKAIAVKIRRNRLTDLWHRASRTSRAAYDSRRSERIYRALKDADLANEWANAMCGPRRALIACRFASKATA